MLRGVVVRLPEALHSTRCKAYTPCCRVWQAHTGRALWAVTRLNTASATFKIARAASSSSSTRWKSRQSRDGFAREAKVAGLKSRAAFKLLEINEKHRLFKRGDTVVDLGYAPGSWSQVALNRTQPGGRVVGIDVIPAQPPRGVSTIQGDFLSPEIREEVRRYVQDPTLGRARVSTQLSGFGEDEDGLTEDELDEEGRGVLERGLHGPQTISDSDGDQTRTTESLSQNDKDRLEGRVVNVVLSDMMMNTSGMAFRDHAGSMDLCLAALTFCYDALITGGHFLCKFYQGAEDRGFELRLKELFEKVHRIKPDSSRKESKEAYFVCLRRRTGVGRDAVLGDGG